MTISELILLLEKYDPATPLVLLMPDLDFGTCMDVEGVIEQFGKRYPGEREWNLDCKDGDPEVVKVLLLD